jgi:hypothetical protein
MTTLPEWSRSEVYKLENATCSGRLRIGRSVEGWELQWDSVCRKGLELQRDSKSGFKRNGAVCRMHSETRPVGKN